MGNSDRDANGKMSEARGEGLAHVPKAQGIRAAIQREFLYRLGQSRPTVSECQRPVSD